MRKATPPIPAKGVNSTDTPAGSPVGATTTTATTVDTTTIATTTDSGVGSSDTTIDNSIINIIDNPTDLIIDNSIKDIIDSATHTPIQTPHEISIQKLSESEALLNDAILQFESAKAALHDATTATQPVVNMDEIDLESEAIRVAAIEAKLSLNCRTAQLVLTARRQRVHNAVKAVKSAVENVNEEVSMLLQNRMKILEKNLSPMLSGLNEFRQVAAALGWRAGSLAEAAEVIERDYPLKLPAIDLPRRVATPNVLGQADIALNGTVAPRPIEGTLADASLFNPHSNGRIQPGDIQNLAEQYRDTLKVDRLIQDVVDAHDNRKFTTAPARRPNYSLGGFVNVTLPTGGSVHAY